MCSTGSVWAFPQTGCPIRKSPDHHLLPTPRRLSQVAASLNGLKSEKDKAREAPGFCLTKNALCGYRPRESSGFPPRAEPPADAGEPASPLAAFGNLLFGICSSGRGKPRPYGGQVRTLRHL